ncbi:MAG: sigma-70 family RNA polymerase sigma factor [Hyphomonadaceae bacterium]|nr:sigma-70 family RNA polymerase sigma factor [Hyphomonadaceae bacterium]
MDEGRGPCTSESTQPIGESCPARLAQAYAEFAGPLRAYLTRILNSSTDAEDVVQDAFLRLHRSGNLAAYDNLRAVVFKTGKRLALNVIRRRRSDALDRSGADTFDEAPSSTPSPEEALIAEEQAAIYMRAIAQLSPRCRQVIELRTVSELSYKEISDTLGLSISTLEKHVVRGKRTCADLVADWRTMAAA